MTITATLQDGFAWPEMMPGTWVETSDTVATLAFTFDEVACETVTPVVPTVVQASCAGNNPTAPRVTLAADTDAIVYSLAGTIARGQTVVVTATLQDGYAWPADTSGVAGWVFETDSASYTVTLANIKCDFRSRLGRFLTSIFAWWRR